MTGTEIFKRTPLYERHAAGLRLHAPQWKLLLAFDGQRTVAEVALNAGVAFAEALPWTEKYLHEGWLAEQPITLDQYLKRAGVPEGALIGAAVPPAVVLYAPRLPSPPANLPPLASAPGQAVTEPGANAAAAGGTALRLAALIAFLLGLTGDKSSARFLVYRVFLRIPPELLEEEGIVSIHLAEEARWVRRAPLQAAIAAAVLEITNQPLPESVYAAA